MVSLGTDIWLNIMVVLFFCCLKIETGFENLSVKYLQQCYMLSWFGGSGAGSCDGRGAGSMPPEDVVQDVPSCHGNGAEAPASVSSYTN